MAKLLDAVTTDTNGTGASHTGPCTVFVHGDLGKGFVELFAAPNDVAGEYVPAGRISRLEHPGVYSCDMQGTYFLKANLRGTKVASSLTVETTQ